MIKAVVPVRDIHEKTGTAVFYYKSPGQQPRMSHACMREFMDIGRAKLYE